MEQRLGAARKRAIFFDVNQTLVLQGASFEQCFQEVWSQYTARWDTGDDTEHGRLWEQYIVRWHQRKKVRSTFKQLDELQQQCLSEAFAALRIPVSDSMARSFIREVFARQTEAKTIPASAYETLALLAPRYALAIISNSPRAEVLHSLARFQLSAFFPAERVFTAQRPAEKKPAPALFKTALQGLGLSPKEAMMVGNSWRHDICGGVKAGLDAVWINESAAAGTDPKKITQHRLGKRQVYLIKRFDQLPALLL